MKLLAIDYGAKRLGLAMCDEAQTLALPHGTYARRVNDSRGDIAALLSLMRAHRVGGVVMGAPAGSSSSENTRDAAQRFAGKLRDAATNAGLDVKFYEVDERYSSALAARGLQASGVSTRRAREEGLIDAGAAAALLQTFLDVGQTAISPATDGSPTETG